MPKLRSLADGLVGTAESFSLEARVFHSVCLLMMAGIGLNIPFNLFTGLYGAAWLMLFVLVANGTVYYLSRRLHLVKIAMGIFLSCCNLVLVVNYYCNSGLDGPTYAIFLLCLLITIAVAPRRQYPVWLSLNVLIMGALFLFDYEHPGTIANAYINRGIRFADFAYTYAVIAAFIVFVVIHIRRAYHHERRMARRRTAELAAANEVKNKLLSVIAHDLKEPLSSIQGFLELLNDADLDEAQRYELQKELRHRTRNASELLSNVLSWTREQMEGFTTRCVSLSLHELAQQVLGLLAPFAQEKAVSLLPLIPVDCCVLADPDMLQLVIRNLLTNAIKFSHPGGDVRLSASIAEGSCTITVRDEGDGIPLAKQEWLFRPGNTSSPGTQKEKGAGLGLYLCREFIERQGGTISFTSDAGLGTTFSVTLPVGKLTVPAQLNSIGR